MVAAFDATNGNGVDRNSFAFLCCAAVEHVMSREQLAAIFNEWARRYAENPEEFSAILDEHGEALEDYGERYAVYFQMLEHNIEQVAAPNPPTPAV